MCIKHIHDQTYFLSHLFAALCYRNAKAYDKARDTYERAADTYYKNHAYPILKKLTVIHLHHKYWRFPLLSAIASFILESKCYLCITDVCVSQRVAEDDSLVSPSFITVYE